MVLSGVPKTFVAGDTWRWSKDFSDYPAPTWAVTYYFENQTKQFSKLATASGTAQAVTIDATDTATYPPGKYRWYARAVSGSIKETIAEEAGVLDVLPDPAAAGTRDVRSFAQRALEAVEAAIEGKASSAQKAFTIGSRSVESYELSDLVQLRDKLRGEVRAEETGGRGGLGRKLQVRVGRG